MQTVEGATGHALLGSSPAMQAVLAQIAQLAAMPWRVRIEGASGTGKRCAAQMLHALSTRARKPFVRCNLNMIADGREHAELVGWVRGAFTGAIGDHAGDFEAAHEGILFLDEVAVATPKVQLALLQLVDEGIVRRIGDHRARRVDVRVICATNVTLEDEVTAGRFREDLYFRMGTHVVRMPALIEHREDIPEIVEETLAHKQREAGMAARSLSTEELERLRTYDWPGNVRELENVMEHFVTWGSLPEGLLSNPARGTWRRHVDDTLTRYQGNKAAAARALGVSRQTLYQELERRQSRALVIEV